MRENSDKVRTKNMKIQLFFFNQHFFIKGMDSSESFLYCKTNVFLKFIFSIWGLHFIVLLSAACFVMETKKHVGEILSTTTAAMISALLWIIAHVTVYFLSESIPEFKDKCIYLSVSCLIMLKKLMYKILMLAGSFHDRNKQRPHGAHHHFIDSFIYSLRTPNEIKCYQQRRSAATTRGNLQSLESKHNNSYEFA